MALQRRWGRPHPSARLPESMPSEPVRIPVSSLSRVMARAASTEESAAACFSVLRRSSVVAGAIGVMVLEERLLVGGCRLVAEKCKCDIQGLVAR